MLKEYATAEQIKDVFNFLENYGLFLIREETLNYGAYVEYKGNGIKVYLGFDYKDYQFNFLIYKDENLKYSDAAYGNEIKPFCDLAKKYDKDFDCNKLQPSLAEGYRQALNNNVELLVKYGANLLKGKEWI